MIKLFNKDFDSYKVFCYILGSELHWYFKKHFSCQFI